MKDSYEHILLQGIKEGNGKIFDYLFHCYYSGLVAFSHSYVKNLEVAEDIVQEFFFQLWLNREKLKIEKAIKSYFFTSVKNRSLDYLKHQKIGMRIESELFYLHSEIKEEQSFWLESELENYLESAMEKLPEKCRKIFKMNRFDGVKPSEIARIENVSVRTVEGHIGKAIRILRSELKKHYPVFLVVTLTSKYKLV